MTRNHPNLIPVAIVFAASLTPFAPAADVSINNFPSPSPQLTILRDRTTGKVYGEQWFINQPPVNVAQFDYPQIKYYPGDAVYVEAGGCVNTGGGGKTCKLFIDPKGDDSDKFYSGLIWLPGAMNEPAGAGLTRIGRALNHYIAIAKTQSGERPPNYFFHIGYQDNNYTDNGYWSMDSGTDDHCQGAGWAWIRISILYDYGTVVPNRPKAPMDLWWDEIDDNSLPLNAKWGFQVTNGMPPNADSLCGHFTDDDTHGCTTWSPTIDEAGTFSICQFGDFLQNTVHGHINWGYATYTGTLHFQDLNNWPGDGDYTILLTRSDQAGATLGNDMVNGLHALVLEFDSGETIDYFDTKWWSDFHSAVDKGAALIGGIGLPTDYSDAKAMLDGKEAIATGQIGIDNQHNAQAELHPVHGLAIHTGSTPTEDVWQVFARNSGNEGSCSQNQHYYPQNQVSFFFQGATDVNTGTSDIRTTDPLATSWSFQKTGKGLIVAFSLPDPQAKAVIFGELHLTRDRAIAAKRIATPPRDPYEQYRNLFKSLKATPEDGNEIWARLVQMLPADRQRQFLLACQQAQKDTARRARMKNGKAPLVEKALVDKKKVLGKNDPRVAEKGIATNKQLEPFDSLLENRRVKIWQLLETTAGGRQAFEGLLRKATTDTQMGGTRTGLGRHGSDRGNK